MRPSDRGRSRRPVAARDARRRPARSNSIVVKSDNARRAARARSLIEQLDTPGRPSGDLFIVYLKNADAARVAQTLRALLTGGEAGATPRAYRTLAPHRRVPRWQAAGARPTPPGACGRSRRCRFRRPAAGVRFRRTARTSRPTRADNALVIMAPEPVYNNLRAIIEKLDVRRAQVYVEALIVEVAARQGGASSASSGRRCPATTRHRRASSAAPTSARAARGTQHHRRRDQSGQRRSGPRRSASCSGTVDDPRARHDHQPRVPRARAGDAGQRQHPVDADAADARQRGGADRRRAEHPVRHRPVRRPPATRRR